MRKRSIVPGATFALGLLLGVAVADSAEPRGAAQDGSLVTGIGGVFMKAEHPDSLGDWYRRHLGLEAGPGGFSFLWREHDDPERVGRTVWSLFRGDSDYFGASDQRFMVNYIVRDLDRVLSRLAEAGIRPVKAPESYPYGRFAWVEDGEGHRIELWEPPPEEPTP
jgi:catechol 2,3-dioxygenase-like lactoylglutathione lyase family enzyme